MKRNLYIFLLSIPVFTIIIYTAFHKSIHSFLYKENPVDSLSRLEHYNKDSDEIVLMRYGYNEIKAGHLSGHYTGYYGKTVVWRADTHNNFSYIGVVPYDYNNK